MSLGLYRTFKSNYIPYFAAGDGRDRYILYDNAGFFHNNPKSLSPSNIYKTGTFFSSKVVQHTKTQSIKAPNFHYHSNGNGRDKYILVNGGGLFSDSKPLISFKLSDFLRKNEEKYDSPKNKKGKINLTKAEIYYNKLIRDKEKGVIKRLYDNEKKKFIKKNKTDFFSFDEIKKIENNINNNEMDKCLTSRYEKGDKIIKKLLPYNLKALKIKKKNSNMNNEIENLPALSERISRDFYSDMNKINHYKELQAQKNTLLKFKKMPYFRILNENSIRK